MFHLLNFTRDRAAERAAQSQSLNPTASAWSIESDWSEHERKFSQSAAPRASTAASRANAIGTATAAACALPRAPEQARKRAIAAAQCSRQQQLSPASAQLNQQVADAQEVHRVMRLRLAGAGAGGTVRHMDGIDNLNLQRVGKKPGVGEKLGWGLHSKHLQLEATWLA